MRDRSRHCPFCGREVEQIEVKKTSLYTANYASSGWEQFTTKTFRFACGTVMRHGAIVDLGSKCTESVVALFKKGTS